MFRHLEPERSPLRTLRRFALDQGGVTAVEYGLMVALIGLVTFAAVSAVGEGILRPDRHGAAEHGEVGNAKRGLLELPLKIGR